MQVSSKEIALSVSTDDGVLGHPCAEIVHIVVLPASAEETELEITETQQSGGARVISGIGWTAEYPQFTGPNGLVIEYRPRHGYLD